VAPSDSSRRVLRRRWSILWALLGLAAPLQAATYHVDPGGDDLASGTAPAPWATLQHAADQVAAGDTVIVHPGHYAGFDLRAPGSAGEWITFTAEPGVLIDAPNGTTGDGINVEDAAYVLVEGFTVQGTSPGAIRNGLRAALSHHVTFRGNRSLDNDLRAFFTGFVDDVVFEDNEGAGSVEEHGIYVSNSGDRPILRGNSLHDNHGAGIHMNGDLSQGGDGIISEALVEGNLIRDNGLGGGAGINCDGVQDSVIRNNLLLGNHATGIALFAIDGAAGSTGNTVVHNTVVNDADGRWALTIADASTGNTVLDNVLLSRHSFRGSIDVRSDSLAGLASDYNVIEDRFTTDGGDSTLTLAQWQAATAQDAHSFTASESALFEDPTLPDGDYHLADTSPAVDAGFPADPPGEDFEGDPRPFGPGADVGADELAHCREGERLLLHDDAVTSDRTEEACEILAGPAYSVEAPAVLTLRVRTTVWLASGFAVQTGAGLRLEVDPQAASP
jgi:hypothetical protein